MFRNYVNSLFVLNTYFLSAYYFLCKLFPFIYFHIKLPRH